MQPMTTGSLGASPAPRVIPLFPLPSIALFTRSAPPPLPALAPISSMRQKLTNGFPGRQRVTDHCQLLVCRSRSVRGAEEALPLFCDGLRPGAAEGEQKQSLRGQEEDGSMEKNEGWEEDPNL